MNITPTVSVIIPTYNRAHLIEDAVRSVLTQSFTSLEVIVVDDGSTDGTSQIFDSIKDPRVVYMPLKKNMGRSFARNEALKIARGDYIAFLDSDDLFLPKKLELQVNYLEKNPDVAMVYTHANCIDLIRNIKIDYHATESGYIYEHIAFFVPLTILLPTVMVRREVFKQVGEFDTKMHRFEDTDMWRRISRDNIIHALPEYTCLIRTHDDNTLTNQDPKVIIDSIVYYTEKIISEDRIDNKKLINGLNNFYGYYIAALNSVPHFQPYAEELEKILKHYDKKSRSISRKLNRLINRIVLKSKNMKTRYLTIKTVG